MKYKITCSFLPFCLRTEWGKFSKLSPNAEGSTVATYPAFCLVLATLPKTEGLVSTVLPSGETTLKVPHEVKDKDHMVNTTEGGG